MRKMKIRPMGNKVQIEVEEPSVGALDTASMPTAIEYGEVLSIGPDVKVDVKKGDHVFFKSWGCDIITYEGKRYYFVDMDTKSLCAVVKQ